MRTMIRPYLYQGDRHDAIRAYAFGHVDVIVFLGLHIPWELEVGEMPVIHIPMKDCSMDERIIKTAVQIITSLIPEKTVLVACQAGMSRSTSICLCTLVAMGIGFEDAEREMRESTTFFPEPTLYAQIRKMLTGELPPYTPPLLKREDMT